MNKSIDILKSIYKPFRYTIKGKTTLLETTSGDFIIKPKNKDIISLYNYLVTRGFDNFPDIIDASRKEVNVFEYIEDTKLPIEQKCEDLIDIITSLHNKTSYFKEVTKDTFNSIYEDIKSNISYLKNYYDTLYEIGFNETYMAPSTYHFMRNFYKINSSLNFCEKELDDWYELVKNETKVRVSVVHNNLELSHFLKGSKEVLISWDDYLIDTPIIDLVKLYKKEYLNIDFSVALSKYLNIFPLLEHEKKLLFILIALPPELSLDGDEFKKTNNVSIFLDYIFKTEDLIRPYYTNNEEEK